MGQAYSTSSLNPEQYPCILLSSRGCCADCTTTSFPFERCLSGFRDHLLWEEFGKVINEQLVILNRHVKLLWTVYTILVIALVVAVQVLAHTDGESDTSTFLALGLIPLVASVLGIQYYIIRRNQKADKAIANTCVEFEISFKWHGFVPEYRTKYTGFCKPYNAKALRLLVFRQTNMRAKV